MDCPDILDFEASGFGRDSYPIEVGYSLASGERFCALILPHETWQYWDFRAEAVHGISRGLLQARGSDVRQICRELNRRNLVFHGRKDSQVKINGYRIEIGEVEQAIAKVIDQKTVVVKRISKEQLPFLKAYIHGPETDVVSLKHKLIEYLPNYMVPAEISFIPEFPLNQNGKVDRKYLENMI